MDTSTIIVIIQTLLSVLGVLLWTSFNDVKNQAKQTNKELSDYKTQVAKEYVSREEIDRIIASLNSTIQQHSVIMSERFNRMEFLIEKLRDKE